MKFVIAPDKFKGSLSGQEFCEIVATEIKKIYPSAELVQLPLADGGDGTLEVVERYLDASVVNKTVSDPFFRSVSATYLYSQSKKTAFIEMSTASGHRLLDHSELDCKEATTLGTGELIFDAIQKGAKNIILGIGGSATNDGGMGVAQALGYRFMDINGEELSPTGKNLNKVARIEKPELDMMEAVKVQVACDVDNPFYGKNGAAQVYAKQKGATPQEIELLDKGLENFAGLIQSTFGLNLQKIPGAGAAGGLGGGAVAFLNGDLVSGIDLIKEIADFDNQIEGADWIITGEGNLDSQTLSGKTIGGVLSSAKSKNIPVAAFCGGIELSVEDQSTMGLDYAVSVSKGISNLEEAMVNAKENLAFAIYNFASILKKNS
ncbi:glycerate kinase [Croceivirga thetidis]|uniref:Glycerate kinase n=1 Tax=Croceivirga thetidis TaxID=2721623 RepID=A0ABX1GKJ4_9FLAO|nr:glycerate kinase [Croceivirga thetidis]NKI30384.1 glycerate kinase [Croceivirga thetidis]